VACEGFLKDKCGPRAKKFEHHRFRTISAFGGNSCGLAKYLQYHAPLSKLAKLSFAVMNFQTISKLENSKPIHEYM